MCVIWTSAWSSENAIASLIFSTGTRQWVWWRLRVWSKTTTWKVNSEPAIELAYRRGRADHSATREWTRVVHGPSISSMQHGLTTIDIKTRSPRLSIAEDALTMAQLSGSTCDSHPRSEHLTHAARPDKRWPRDWTCNRERLWKRLRASSRTLPEATTPWTTTTSTTGIIDDTLNNNVNDSFNGNDIGRNDHRTGFDYGPSPDYDFGTVK